MGKFNAQELSNFAQYYGFHYDVINPSVLVKEILSEMERGLEGKISSLPMIPSYITPVTQIPSGKTVLALDAGGTNLRASLVHFNENGEAVTHGTKKTCMPGTNGYVNAEQFFSAIAETVLPLLTETKVEGIGFTFSYPMEITSDADGILMEFSKEVDAPEVIGKAVGKGLREALADKGYKYDGPIVMLNDTVATLLSGLVSIPQDGQNKQNNNDYGANSGPVIGFILGTGFNTAYPETKIPKINFDSPDSPQIIVSETGNFNIRYRGILDKEFDNTTKFPGSYPLEKGVSGAYLGPLTLHILKHAVKDKVIQFKRSDELLNIKHLDTKTLNDFICAPLTIAGPIGSLFNSDESDAAAGAQYLTSIITERGALFSAGVLAATIERMNPELKPHSPVRIAVEGSTYLLFKDKRRALDSYLHQILYKDKPRPYVILPVEHGSLFGAAVAALSKK